jgi:hypothetical protein
MRLISAEFMHTAAARQLHSRLIRPSFRIVSLTQKQGKRYVEFKSHIPDLSAGGGDALY